MRIEIIAIVAAGLLLPASTPLQAGPRGRSIGFGPGRSLDARKALLEAGELEITGEVRAVPAGYIPGAGPDVGKPEQPVEWVPIPGTDSAPLPHWTACGSGRGFCLGTTTLGSAELPVREIVIRDFEMSKTPVTVEQYGECVARGQCTRPDDEDFCNWGKPGRERHPANCVDWEQARRYADFMGARLPTESEWEYAATGGGMNRMYPWGNEAPTCERAVMYGDDRYGCGENATMPVCSKPAGNTVHGLCDMSGNVWEWVQDKYWLSYSRAPADGGAVEGSGLNRVLRGGSFVSSIEDTLRSDYRYADDPRRRCNTFGFRIAR